MGATVADDAEAAASAAEPPELSRNDVFELLSNRRRRFAVHALEYADDPLEFSELSRYVAAWEQGLDPAEVEYEDRRHVHSTLRRTHLPKLEEKNVVKVDEEAERVEPTPALEEVDVYLEVLKGKEIPWSEYYVGLSGVALALTLAVWVDAWPFAAASTEAILAFVAVAFAVSALAHKYLETAAQLGTTEKPPELRR